MINEQQALELLKKYNLPDRVINHCRIVSNRAKEIAKRINMKGIASVDAETEKIAGLLHDIGRANRLAENGYKESIENGHERESEKILEAEGLPEIAKLIRRHGVQTLLCNPSELSLEEKVIIYADLTTSGTDVCTSDERYRRSIEIYSEGPRKDLRVLGLLKENWHKFGEIEEEIKGLM